MGWRVTSLAELYLFLRRANKCVVYFNSINWCKLSTNIQYQFCVIQNEMGWWVMSQLPEGKENSRVFKRHKSSTNEQCLFEVILMTWGGEWHNQNNYVQYFKHQASTNVHFCGTNEWQFWGFFFFFLMGCRLHRAEQTTWFEVSFLSVVDHITNRSISNSNSVP